MMDILTLRWTSRVIRMVRAAGIGTRVRSPRSQVYILSWSFGLASRRDRQADASARSLRRMRAAKRPTAHRS